MKVTIVQGHSPNVSPKDHVIVIDVLRAFTFAHIAFLKGVDKIILVKTINQALQLKEEQHDYLLAGEVNGLAINGFDLDNSPNNLMEHNIQGKTLVQKTTNGVEATLHCLHSKQTFVTGLTNAKTTVKAVKKQNPEHVLFVASHPSSDEDLACADYMKKLLLGLEPPNIKQIIKRINDSTAAKKFLCENSPEFLSEDLRICTEEINSDFAMKVTIDKQFPMLERFFL